MNSIDQVIIERHTHGNQVDEEQLDAVFSPESHLVVEAPAGYGKTKTMVSKIAYLIATGCVPYPKKVLALTFSVNAAFKIRRDIKDQLPSILSISPSLSSYALHAVYATNYHGLCRRILKRYGYLVSSELSQIEKLRGIGIDIYSNENYTAKRLHQNLGGWQISLSPNEIEILVEYTRNVRLAGDPATCLDARQHLSKNAARYLQIVSERFLPKGYILFDAILLFTRQLLAKYPQVRDFYRAFFPIVVVDEFQDTNMLQWTLLQDIVGRNDETKNQLFIFGDRCQMLYEFIGAIEGIIDDAKSSYGMCEIGLETNHRFENNLDLLRFDENVRRIAQNPRSPNIQVAATIRVLCASDQDEEARQILSQVKLLLEQDPQCTVAILTRSRKDKNTLKIVDHFNREENFAYFFALYSDEDEEYVDFHRRCLSCLYENLADCRSFQSLARCIQIDMVSENSSETWKSLQILLKTFMMCISREFRFLPLDEKIDLVIDTFRNNALKQYLMHVTSSRVILSTIHGSKGLEWNYVILPDMERSSFPPYPGLCRICDFEQECRPDWKHINPDGEFARLYNRELNVFYVGGTRAKRGAYFIYSNIGLNASGEPRTNNPSCFLSLDGLQAETGWNSE